MEYAAVNGLGRKAAAAKEKGLESVQSCLFCGSSPSSVAAESVEDFFFRADPASFDYLRCEECRSLWLKDRPVGDRLIAAYASYYTHAVRPTSGLPVGIRGWLRDAYINVRFRNVATLPERLAIKAVALTGRDNSQIDAQFRFAPPSPAHILDYGCGSGEYLLKMQPLGYSLSGAEYDPEVLTNLSRLGIHVEDVTTIGDGYWKKLFDHVTLSHVLEHVPDPRALLKRLYEALKPGGTIFVEVPNADATGFEIFGRLWRGLEAPRHFSLPNRTALVRALTEAGFVFEYQHMNTNARTWVWSESLSVCGDAERGAAQRAMAEAPPESPDNAEFLTVVARRPSDS